MIVCLVSILFIQSPQKLALALSGYTASIVLLSMRRNDVGWIQRYGVGRKRTLDLKHCTVVRCAPSNIIRRVSREEVQQGVVCMCKCIYMCAQDDEIKRNERELKKQTIQIQNYTPHTEPFPSTHAATMSARAPNHPSIHPSIHTQSPPIPHHTQHPPRPTHTAPKKKTTPSISPGVLSCTHRHAPPKTMAANVRLRAARRAAGCGHTNSVTSRMDVPG
ncbi:hypothetical protein OF83DRAFT_488744 [Amylostereum chailletii]|nr:hypothetical protein OF83DRAFT_488744 [Amylostereum chailletii]